MSDKINYSFFLLSGTDTVLNAENLRPYYDDLHARFHAVKDMEMVFVNGKHHFHSDMPEFSASHCIRFLKERIENTEFNASPVADFHSYFDAPPMALKIENVAGSFVPPKGFEEVVFDVFEMQIAVKIWGNRNGSERIMALCDQGDNSASFDIFGNALAKASNGICLVAYDPVGVGQSSHLPDSGFYKPGENSLIVLALMEELGWQDGFSLLGHGKFGATTAIAGL